MGVRVPLRNIVKLREADGQREGDPHGRRFPFLRCLPDRFRVSGTLSVVLPFFLRRLPGPRPGEFRDGFRHLFRDFEHREVAFRLQLPHLEPRIRGGNDCWAIKYSASPGCAYRCNTGTWGVRFDSAFSGLPCRAYAAPISRAALAHISKP